MKYISQTIDFISYKNGEGVEVENQIEQYYMSTSKVTPTSSDADWISGWVYTIPNPYGHKDDNGNELTYYVWRRQETHWSNGQITYVGVELMSEFDIVTALAQQAGKSVGAWCIENNVTIIDGSTIMTGSINSAQIASDAIETKHLKADLIESKHIKTDSIDAGHIKADAITADKIKVDNLSAISADLGTLTAGTIDASKVTVTNLNADNIASGTIDASKVTVTNLDAAQITTGQLDADRINVQDLSAFNATIGGWTIDEERVYKDSVGLSAGASKFLRPSLVEPWTDSPVRFYAGTLVETLIPQKEETFTFNPSAQGELLTEALDKNAVNVDYSPKNVTHAPDSIISQTQTITLAKETLTYKGEIEFDLFPTWVLEEHITELTATTLWYIEGEFTLTPTYVGEGRVKVAALGLATASDSATKDISVRVEGNYSFTETLDIDIDFGDAEVTANFIPRTTEEYSITFTCHCDSNNNQKFSVLADGSLYASAAKLEGDIIATSGQIGGCSIEDGILHIKNANADNLIFTRGTVGNWHLGQVDISLSASESIQAYALYSDEMYEKRTTSDGYSRTYTYRVYLTPKGVYVQGRYDTSNESAVPYYASKTWLDICEN